MAEERESQKNQQTGYQEAGRNDDDVEGHVNVPLLDDTDPELAKLKLANDEDDDDDVEAHKIHGEQVP
jgi:hypothetical protein